MGIYDRDYLRDADFRGGRGGLSGPRSWSLITWLIVINVAVHLVQMLWLDADRVGWVSRRELFDGHVYLLLTYQFVHADVWHVGLNMLMLYFMGRPLVEQVGKATFLKIYFGAGLLGGLVQILYSPDPIMGASAAVFGVLYAVITLTPWREVYLMLFFVIPVRAQMWKIGMWLAVFEIGIFAAQAFGLLTLGQHGIANLAHLGGAFFGWLWIAWIWPQRRGHGRREAREREERWNDRYGMGRVVDAEVLDERSAPSDTPRKPKPFVSEEIDAILDKISAHGMQSLTEEEKRLLQQSSERLARRVEGK
ncbi:MAG: rhomboid family intramembrane serine protease [Verrucomicrobiales bacterium]|nr:rhomboid family intramembrane serine protease [Verrucomicrobiales bacterium]